jgi:2-octaprenyl-6-methoxyphenol hydroxylase
LKRLGVWDALAPLSAPLAGIRLADPSARLFRAPEVLFLAREIGLDLLGYNVPNDILSDELWRLAGATPGLELVDDTVVQVVSNGDGVEVVLASGETIDASLVVAADGRNSLCRSAAGIAVENVRYEQCAVVARFAHSRPHQGISTELQDVAGPCTTVPLPGNNSSLVWVVTPDVAPDLVGAGPEAFARRLEDKLHGLLGSISGCRGIKAFPLSSMSAQVLARNRVALVGEAGHLLPPIGAQGLNMGLADAAAIAELVAGAVRDGIDPGAASILDAYHAARSGDVWRRSLAVDTLNRSYLSTLLPGHLLRGAGLHTLAAVGPLKREIMRRGLEPDPLPVLMR